ncbi:MAG: NADH-quinone oxidoreductase subunit J [Desulfobulbus sp.]|jgi:NADH-quinone oxidoreductase subunit J
MFLYLFFGYCALMIIGCGILAITLRNPVHAVLSVLVLFFHMAGLYLTLNAEFLAAVQVIVYAGAILVLYLFVLFLVDLRNEVHIDPFIRSAWSGRIIAIALCAALLGIIPFFSSGDKGGWTTEAILSIGNTKALGQELYSTYLLPFELAGLILLVAVVGGLAMARRPTSEQSAGCPCTPAADNPNDANSAGKEVER